MIKVEPFKNFSGFGSGGTPGGYFYSQGMNKSQFGIVPGWNIQKVKDDADLASLKLINFFTQGNFGSTNYVYGLDAQGSAFRSELGLTSWALQYKAGGNNSGNGIFFDQKNRLLIATDRYLVKGDGSADYADGTVAVSNGSNAVVGTGTTFVAGMVGHRFLIAGDTDFYTVATFTDATHITLNTTYTGTGGSGLTYTIFTSFTEQWKDFGASYETTALRQMDNYEDWVCIANDNAVAVLNVTDDSFNNIALSLPAGYKVRCVRAS